jgi:hypothetical protein
VLATAAAVRMDTRLPTKARPGKAGPLATRSLFQDTGSRKRGFIRRFAYQQRGVRAM